MSKIVLAFGRMNPPTIGHEKLVEECAKVARAEGCDYQIYLSNTNKKPKDPLDPQTKIKLVKKMFPSHASHIHVDKAIFNPFKLMEKFNAEYEDAIWVAGGEDAANYERNFTNHMKKESPDFFYLNFRVHSSGERSADSDGATGMSATKMRNFAVQGDFAQFRSGMPRTISDDECKKVMKAIRDYLL